MPSVRAMECSFKTRCRVVALVLLVLLIRVAGAAGATTGPSDCRPRDADSTCAVAVASSTTPDPPTRLPVDTLYDGPLGGVPSVGYSYWGWDFMAERAGSSSPVRQDEYINRSRVPVSITLSFDVPAQASCARDCLPGVEFEIGPGWYKVDPPYVRIGASVSLTATIEPAEGYAWVIALWQASKPRLSVSVPKGSGVTLADVGLVPTLAIANEVPLVVGTCYCNDGTMAYCSDGSRFSNGLLGSWDQTGGGYSRAGAFTSCAIVH